MENQALNEENRYCFAIILQQHYFVSRVKLRFCQIVFACSGCMDFSEGSEDDYYVDDVQLSDEMSGFLSQEDDTVFQQCRYEYTCVITEQIEKEN